MRERKRQLEDQLNTPAAGTADALTRTQEAMKEFQQNTDFRRWWHKNYKSDQKITDGNTHNPDLGAAEILEGFEEWVRNGRPKAN